MLKQGEVCTECWAWGSVFGLLGVGQCFWPIRRGSVLYLWLMQAWCRGVGAFVTGVLEVWEWAWGRFVTNDWRKRGGGFYLFLKNSMFLNRRQRGVFCHQWQTEAWELAGVLFFTSFDGWISRSERGGFLWDWKWLEHFGIGQQFWKLVNLVWTWLFFEFLINSVLIPSGCDSKM